MSTRDKGGWGTKPCAGSRGIWLAGVCAACSPFGPTSSHAQEAAPAPAAAQRVHLTPSVTLQETITDNAGLTATDRISDFITRGVAGLEAAVDTGRTLVMAQGELAYDWYANHPRFSGWSADGKGKVIYSVISDRLTLEANGTLTDGYASSADISVFDRSGTPNRVQLAAYDLGPRVNGRLGDVADLTAALQFGQLFYWGANGSRVTTLPDDDNTLRFTARADTGDRSRRTQLTTTVQVDGDSQGYRSANGIQSVYVQAVPSLRLLGRAGYEYILDPGVQRIDAEILSAGIELTPNERSRITLEGGRRYGGPTWGANATLLVGAKVSLNASYTEVFQPDQLFVANTLLAQTNDATQQPPTVVPPGFTFIPSLYNQASLNKSAAVHAIFAGPVQSLEAGTNWSDRYFYTSHDHGREWVSNATYGRRLNPQLTLTIAATYARTFESPIYGASEAFTGTVGLIYAVSRSVDVYLRYGATHSRQISPNDQTINENAVQLAVRKRL